MNEPISYRKATIDDATSISRLSLSIQEKYAFPSYDEKTKNKMLALSSAHAIEVNINNGDDYLLAEFSQEPIAVIHSRNCDEIVQLFVAPKWQSRGIPSQLWQTMRESAVETYKFGTIQLWASELAVTIYRNWGFEINGCRKVLGATSLIPMQYKFG